MQDTTGSNFLGLNSSFLKYVNTRHTVHNMYCSCSTHNRIFIDVHQQHSLYLWLGGFLISAESNSSMSCSLWSLTPRCPAHCGVWQRSVLLHSTVSFTHCRVTLLTPCSWYDSLRFEYLDKPTMNSKLFIRCLREPIHKNMFK